MCLLVCCFVISKSSLKIKLFKNNGLQKYKKVTLDEGMSLDGNVYFCLKIKPNLIANTGLKSFLNYFKESLKKGLTRLHKAVECAA